MSEETKKKRIALANAVAMFEGLREEAFHTLLAVAMEQGKNKPAATSWEHFDRAFDLARTLASWMEADQDLRKAETEAAVFRAMEDKRAERAELLERADRALEKYKAASRPLDGEES